MARKSTLRISSCLLPEKRTPFGIGAITFCDVRGLLKEHFDVQYLSRFTPDELYKTAIHRRNTNLFRYALQKMRLANWHESGD
jgi:hypothetical protein